MSNIHEQLVQSIQLREQKQTEWNGGILTADKYIRTMQECVGSDLCYRFASKGNVSFDDILRKSTKTLTYNNPEMVIEDTYSDFEKAKTSNDWDFELPKNTLMVFRHILTTPRKDRDGDILRTQGAKPDPNMLLLWQHVHTLPIGKMLGIVEHNSKRLEVVTAIIDMNELSHDAAVMVDNKMGRFSHGFKALEFDSIKEEEGRVTSPGGFDVKAFEIMEESLVSVPSNVDAQTQEILLSLVEGGKMTSDLMKEYGKEIREKRPTQSSLSGLDVPINLKLTINGKDLNNADQPGDGKDAAGTAGKGTKCGCGGSSEKTDANRNEDQAATEQTQDKEVISIEKCGAMETSKDRPIQTSGFVGWIPGSWEDIERKLRDKARVYLIGKGIVNDADDWPLVLGTFQDYVILVYESKYYKVSWSTHDGQPVYTGAPKEVDIQMSAEVKEKLGSLTSEKAGKVLSQRNYKMIKEVADDMDEIHEGCATRGTKALCKQCKGKLMDVLKSTGMEDEQPKQTQEITTKSAMSKVISDCSIEERNHLIKTLQALNEMEAKTKQTQAYRKLIGQG